MLIRLLGGVGATTDHGEPVDIGAAKCQSVLAVLALEPGSAVPVPRIIDLVWGEQPPHTAAKTLQSYVVRLRRALGAAAIVRVGAAYRLDLPAESVDVARFRRQLDSGDVEAALAEWTGTPLAGLEGHGLTPVIDALTEQWLSAVETHLEQGLETDPVSIISPLTELTASHPFREPLWCLLMTAFYRVGRQADALQTFSTARRLLVDELGVEPGARLRELESLVLEQDEQLRGLPTAAVQTCARPTGTVTFACCEVEDSALLWSTHRKKMAAAVFRLDGIVRAAVDRHGGYVFASANETFGAAFDRADTAVGWARDLQLEVATEPWPGGVELRLRIGIHTGETEERAGGYYGAAVNTAARIAAAGHGGQILVSEVAGALLEQGDLLHLGSYRLEGELSALGILQLDEGRHPDLRTEDVRRGNLPLHLERLIGRSRELDTVREALAQSPVVTLVGPGGIGKTRLALAAGLAGLDRVGGVWLIELANIPGPEHLARAVADVLDVRERSGRTLTQAIIAALQSRSALLLLDSCEHVVDAAAELVQAITRACPLIQVLATSQEALGVSGEQLICVGPLDPAPAGVQLFNDRAHAVSAGFDAVVSRDAVAEICRRLDGIPLAIELAAARTRTLTPSDLLARLDQRLDLLTGRRTSPERHRTLRATIEWSHNLLGPAQRELFQRLSVFAGPFDRADAGQVVADEILDRAEVDQLLEDLVEKSMLIVESGPFGMRFSLLETIGQYAAERLREAGSDDLMAQRHAQWCLWRVTEINQLLVGAGEIEGVARLGQLWPNLRAAFTWACDSGDHRLAAALVRPVAGELNLRQQSEIRDWAERILAITPPDDEDQIVSWLCCATYGCKQSGDFASYKRLVDRYVRDHAHPVVRYTRSYLYDDASALRVDALEAMAWLTRNGQDQAALYAQIGGMGAALMSTGRFPELDDLLCVLIARYRRHGPPSLLYVTLAMLGYSALFQGRAETAERLFDESASLEVPARTSSVNEPAQARKAFKAGHQAQAFRILLTHVHELLETDYTDLARLAAVEFINMMTAVGRLSEAAQMLGFLAGTGGFGTLAVQALVTEATAKIAAGAPPAGFDSAGATFDGRQALAYMRDVLERECGDQPPAGHTPSSSRISSALSVA